MANHKRFHVKKNKLSVTPTPQTAAPPPFTITLRRASGLLISASGLLIRASGPLIPVSGLPIRTSGLPIPTNGPATKLASQSQKLSYLSHNARANITCSKPEHPTPPAPVPLERRINPFQLTHLPHLTVNRQVGEVGDVGVVFLLAYYI